MKNTITYKVYGRYALFTDPVTKIGGEKCSYHIPTYEALKGITKSIYWKPALIWHIDRVRVMKRIRTEAKNVKPVKFGGGNDLSIYTYLADVEYQVQAHFEFNRHRQDLKDEFHDGKHFNIALRMLEKGGRRDICLGCRECQAYVEPCEFGSGTSHYDHSGELAYGFMFHGFDYPDENGNDELWSRFAQPVMKDGIVNFPGVDDTHLVRKFVRKMKPNPPKSCGLDDPTLQVEGIQP
jgi:CRISPR-associated protein Cas5d